MADISASLDFGSTTRSKRETVAELCALLAFSASLNDDKVGLTLFHGGVDQYIPPRKGQKHALRVVREVLTHESKLAAQQQRHGRHKTTLAAVWTAACVVAVRASGNEYRRRDAVLVVRDETKDCLFRRQRFF